MGTVACSRRDDTKNWKVWLHSCPCTFSFIFHDKEQNNQLKMKTVLKTIFGKWCSPKLTVEGIKRVDQSYILLQN